MGKGVELTLIHIGQNCVAESNQLEEPCYILEKGWKHSHHSMCYTAPYVRMYIVNSTLHLATPHHTHYTLPHLISPHPSHHTLQHTSTHLTHPITHHTTTHHGSMAHTNAHWLVFKAGSDKVPVVEHEVLVFMRIPLQVDSVPLPLQLRRSVTFRRGEERVGREGERGESEGKERGGGGDWDEAVK